MKKTKSTEEQMLFGLRQGSAGQRSLKSAGRWRSARRRITSGMSVTRIWASSRSASCDNCGMEAHLKRQEADLTLDRQELQKVVKKDLATR